MKSVVQQLTRLYPVQWNVTLLPTGTAWRFGCRTVTSSNRSPSTDTRDIHTVTCTTFAGLEFYGLCMQACLLTRLLLFLYFTALTLVTRTWRLFSCRTPCVIRHPCWFSLIGMSRRKCNMAAIFCCENTVCYVLHIRYRTRYISPTTRLKMTAGSRYSLTKQWSSIQRI